MLSWFSDVDLGSLVELDEATMAAAEKLLQRLPYYHRRRPNYAFLAGTAIKHVAGLPNADAILAAGERERLEAIFEKCERVRGPHDRKSWPWTREDGLPWTTTKGRGDKKVAVSA